MRKHELWDAPLARFLDGCSVGIERERQQGEREE